MTTLCQRDDNGQRYSNTSETSHCSVCHGQRVRALSDCVLRPNTDIAQWRVLAIRPVLFWHTPVSNCHSSLALRAKLTPVVVCATDLAIGVPHVKFFPRNQLLWTCFPCRVLIWTGSSPPPHAQSRSARSSCFMWPKDDFEQFYTVGYLKMCWTSWTQNVASKFLEEQAPCLKCHHFTGLKIKNRFDEFLEEMSHPS